jgi:hypothetical protein
MRAGFASQPGRVPGSGIRREAEIVARVTPIWTILNDVGNDVGRVEMNWP